MRLIDASDAERRSREPSIYDLTDVPDFLAECPTVDAEPVRHGHWIPVKAMVGIDPVTMDFKIGDADRCSLCSTDFVSVQTKYKYCPFCGAKMDGGEANGN